MKQDQTGLKIWILIREPKISIRIRIHAKRFKRKMSNSVRQKLLLLSPDLNIEFAAIKSFGGWGSGADKLYFAIQGFVFPTIFWYFFQGLFTYLT